MARCREVALVVSGFRRNALPNTQDPSPSPQPHPNPTPTPPPHPIHTLPWRHSLAARRVPRWRQGTRRAGTRWPRARLPGTATPAQRRCNPCPSPAARAAGGAGGRADSGAGGRTASCDRCGPAALSPPPLRAHRASTPWEPALPSATESAVNGSAGKRSPNNTLRSRAASGGARRWACVCFASRQRSLEPIHPPLPALPHVRTPRTPPAFPPPPPHTHPSRPALPAQAARLQPQEGSRSGGGPRWWRHRRPLTRRLGGLGARGAPAAPSRAPETAP